MRQEVELHCVFRCGTFWFALPASSLREVAPRPMITAAPLTDPALLGLCHLRNDFLPVLSLPHLLGTEPGGDVTGEQILVLGTRGAPWAVVVDAVAALEPLEISINTDCRSDDGWLSAMLGSATTQGQIVRVLDPTALYELAVQVLTPEASGAGATILNA